MGRPYTVRSGDTLTKIARQHGYASWEEIYNHEENADFRARRPNPNRIHPGDVLMLPDRGPAAGAPSQPAPAPAQPAPEPQQPEEETRPAQPGVAARRNPQSQTGTVLSSRYELREIVVAQGIEHLNTNPWMQPSDQSHSGAPPHGWRIPRGLERHFPNNREHEWARIDDTSAEFVSHTQRVRFRIRVITAKNEFKRAVETAGLHVVYMGHSRYGRGPCFGPDPSPGEDWEQGSDTNTRGLFRMGYRVIGVHLSEIRQHGYRFYPVPASTRIESSWRHPELPSQLRSIPLPDDLRARVLSQGQPLQDRYWGFRDGEGDGVVLWAGWKDTISRPMDLDATNLQCRCLCIFSCSTRLHYWRAVRRWKSWQRTATDHYAYFTTAVSYPLTTWAWLRAVLAYPRRNDFQPWYRSLEWAKQHCARILRQEGYRYAIY